MYLKSIEIQGFKSFANKMKFEFHNGITGIVGPNGSGKSNVADAVRWVLGEQKIKQLRGAKMEDVIFAGTESRKPLGFAYVAITLDNTDNILPIDFEEVTVSRRLFRSGESEYMINGSACRLKDINELFYDTGIGKEGYSIIGQGQIDKILSGKPEERRELFDEAAGIVKFKRRKKEALKKLEDENQNLVRVEDILSELEKQVGPLEEQAETAKEYLRFREELKKSDINMFLLQMEHSKKQLNDVVQKLEIASDDLTDANVAFDEIKKDYEKLDAYIQQLNDSIEEKKNRLNEGQLSKEKLDGEIRVLNEQINSIKTNDEYIGARVKSITDSIVSHKTEREQLLNRKQELENNIKQETQLQSDISSNLLNSVHKASELSEEVETYKKEIIRLLNEKASVQTKIQRFDTMLEQIEVRKTELGEKLKEFHSNKDLQETIISDFEKELSEINEEINNVNETDEAISAEISDIKARNINISQQLEQTQIRFHKEKSRLESLKNLTERYEGYGNSIKKLMELKESKKGIIGVVADIIKVDKKYETAIETALGGSIQNIVTDTETTAKELIEYLKKNKYGRATFLPLSSMNNKTGFTNERVLHEQGVIGLACDLVNTKTEYAGVIKYLLGRTVIVDEINHAITLARKYSYTLRIVTLEGEQLNPGGSMSGGAFRNSSNLLGRRREIEEVGTAVKTLQAQSNTLHNEVADNKKILSGLYEKQTETKQILQEQYLLQNTVKMNLSQAGDKKEELLHNFEDFQRETDEIGERILGLNTDNGALKDELQSIEDKNLEIEEKIKQLLIHIEKVKISEAEKQQENEEIKTKITNLTNQHGFTVENIERVDLEMSRLEQELMETNNNSSDSGKIIEERIDQIKWITQELEKNALLIEETAGELEVLNFKKEEQAREHKEFFSKREAVSLKISDLDKELYRLNGQKEKLEDANDNLIDYMWNEYEITFSAAQAYRDEQSVSMSELKKKIQTLKSKIKALGDININAIEDFKNVGERYEFLKNQYNDLTVAKESLMKIIEELDSGMRKQFTEKLKDIREEFDKVFKELFGGGKGEIELEDEGDILETGIRIISQPPGKKLQNMMQMSGGEKALTAISLLFAIQNLKPSPFCLLDEIEAALDGTNVVRFAEYLHKLTKNTQFIVITHRRGTMNCADRLYGITMQEKGISTLVSVNLLESELEK